MAHSMPIFFHGDEKPSSKRDADAETDQVNPAEVLPDRFCVGVPNR